MNSILKAAVAATLMLGASYATAQDPGFYIGGSAGMSSVKDGCGVLPAGITCDDKSTAWRGFAGYQIDKHFGIEAGYGRLAQFDASGPGGSAKITANAWEASLIAGWPFTPQFSVYGRLGGYAANTKLSSTVGISGNENTTDLTFGFGARFDFARQFAARLEWQRYNDVGGNTIGKSDISVIGVAGILKF